MPEKRFDSIEGIITRLPADLPVASKTPDQIQLEKVREELQTLSPVQLYKREGRRFVKLPESEVVKPTAEELEIMEKATELAPKWYDEKLFWLADVQLLDLTHQQSLGAIMKYAEEFASTFTHVVYGGDIFDFTQQSHFPKDNSRGDQVTTDEIEAGKWFMDWTNKTFAHCKRIFIKGNHEDRYKNFYENTTNGIKQWLVPLEERYHLEDWEMFEYGRGQSFDWHGIKMWHGEKGGLKQNTPKLEVERAFRSVTFGHSPFNRTWEAIDADGNVLRGVQHAGVSDHPEYSKNGYKQVSDGFGVYYWGKDQGIEVRSDYSISIAINNPRFISPEGKLFSGEGFNIRKEVGLGEVIFDGKRKT